MRLAPSRIARLAAVLALALAGGSCRKAEADRVATLTVHAGEDPGRSARFEANVPGWPGAEASFTADMAHPGMKPIVVKASETAPGRYAGVIVWTMPGDWKVFFEARWPDGTKVERSANITVTRD